MTRRNPHAARDECPNRANHIDHTEGPDGCIEWRALADRMTRTQEQCPDCEYWVIVKPKETPMTTDLPTWADLTDLDKGNVLLHLHKREYEGGSYAEEHYPASFTDHPALVALDSAAACAFAKSMHSDANALHHDEYGRLYDLALDADQ